MAADLSPELSEVVESFLGQRAWSAEAPDPGSAPPLWAALTTELGLPGLLVEERYGGQGGAVTDLAAALVQTGRAGWCGPLVPVAGVAVDLLGRLDPGDGSGLRARVAAGGIVVPALHERDSGRALETVRTRAEVSGASAVVTGEKVFVEAGRYAEAFLVTAAAGDGAPVLCAVEREAAGVRVEPMEAVDDARGYARLVLTDAAAVPLTGAGAEGEAEGAVRDAWLLGALLVAAESVGVATRALELSVDYARTRRQFGRPVAEFQAVKHKLVEMYAELATAQGALRAAVREHASGGPGWRFAASAAKARSSDAVMHVLREAVQVHGGIGFTWEHELSRHFRRAVNNRAAYGTPVRHRELVAAESGF
ncbi:acyl-CoA dehydrogenase family protein [Actinomadura rugatobispora]|uniref:Acyl-CoA dehydrogenase family protein n=1 Tax=Actinomadura rugatobispora TaxID=1994 RepID=A0ABW1A8J1_9ACTN|nr:acyl-CoA dehydrogenase family protein [Actinomadura rugatobispora]